MQFQQWLRPARRGVARSYYEGMRCREDLAGWSRSDKETWILRRLQFSVRRAFEETLYYREMFQTIGFDPYINFSFDEFAHLPIIERRDIQREGKRLLSNVIPLRRLRRDATGGSTGSPTEIWLGTEEEGWAASGREFFHKQVGVPAGTRTAALWGHHLDPVASDRLLDRFVSFAHNGRWFDCFRLSSEILESYHHELDEYRPACVVAYANAMGQLAEHILERGYRPRYPTRCVITGAEKLQPGHREVIERVFGRPVHERYGSRDVGLMAFQVDPARTHDLTVDWCNIFIEPESDSPQADILITKLHADGMPLIRYRVGDIGLFPDRSLPGHPTFILHEVLGRSLDRIWLPNGKWIHGIQFPHLMKDHPVREFMLVQNPDFSVQLDLVPKRGFSEASRREIEATISANLQGLALRVGLVDEIHRTKAGKWRPVMSHIDFEKMAARGEVN